MDKSAWSNGPFLHSKRIVNPRLLCETSLRELLSSKRFTIVTRSRIERQFPRCAAQSGRAAIGSARR